MLAPEDKSAFDQVRNNDDALGVIEDRIWNAVIRSFLNAVHDICRRVESLDGIFPSRRCPDICGGENESTCGNKRNYLHKSVLKQSVELRVMAPQRTA
jgi:hypothetical protein